MAIPETSVVWDFGPVGYHNGPKQHFCVEIDAEPFAQLCRDVEIGHRLYELLSLNRPGDLLAYLRVNFTQLPDELRQRVTKARHVATDANFGSPPWPEGTMPYARFSSLLYSHEDDMQPSDEAWHSAWRRDSQNALLDGLFASANLAKQLAPKLDVVSAHVCRRILAGRHDYDYLPRDTAIAMSRNQGPAEDAHTEDYYATLREVLRDPRLASVAYRADGDWRVLRELAIRQRQCALTTGHCPGDALHLSALVNLTIDNKAWDSEIWFFSEGLAHGDLFIEGPGELGLPIGELIKGRYRSPPLYILTTSLTEEIEGYDVTQGEGWFLRTRRAPATRRQTMAEIASRRSSVNLGPVMAFKDEGATLFEHEKTAIVVGTAVDPDSRECLARILARWEHAGGQPLVMVAGDDSAFRRHRSRRVIPIGDTLAHKQLNGLLSPMTWVDALVALHAPADFVAYWNRLVDVRTDPWPPWVVATPGSGLTRVDLELEQALSLELAEAERRALTKRRWLR